METHRSESSKAPITLNLDEFDIDSYDFKPVTKGLGFHDPLEKGTKPRSRMIPKADSKETLFSGHKSYNKKVTNHLQNTPTTVSDPSLMSGIDALYGKTISENPMTLTKKEKNKVTLREASLGEMMGSYIIDVSIIAFITLILFASFFAFAFKMLQIEMILNFLTVSMPYVSIIAALIYLTYFSILEPVGTIGKKLFGLGCYLSGTKKRATIKNSFLRSIISLLSLPLLGVPMIFDFQGKLSDTSVMKKKK
ncbi:MAG: RDD family protein [Bacteriovoracaceae bacterium]|nr:RDD family protein [Bacteriovoracaceae bacterium]